MQQGSKGKLSAVFSSRLFVRIPSGIVNEPRRVAILPIKANSVEAGNYHQELEYKDEQADSALGITVRLTPTPEFGYLQRGNNIYEVPHKEIEQACFGYGATRAHV